MSDLFSLNLRVNVIHDVFQFRDEMTENGAMEYHRLKAGFPTPNYTISTLGSVRIWTLNSGNVGVSLVADSSIDLDLDLYIGGH